MPLVPMRTIREKIESWQSSPAVKIAIFAVLVNLAFIFGLGVPSREKTTEWYKAVAYYNVFTCFLLWLTTLPFLSWNREKALEFLRKHAAPFFLAGLIVILAIRTSPPQFRILADETNLLGTASAMYDQRKCFNPTQMIFYYEGVSEVVSSEWDIRPLFYPFLVSMAHSFLGYSENNSFVVNAIAGVFLLWGFYFLLQRWFTRFFGVLGMLLLASVPLLIMWITSGGFEIVNLLFAILSFLAFDHFLTHRRAEQAEFLVFTLVLLAQVRYESGLFAICMVPFIPFFLEKGEFGKFSPRVFLLPFLFLPLVWHRMMLKAENYLLPGTQDLFSLGHFKDHLKPAWNFFWGSNQNFAMIPLLFYGFLLSLGYAVFWIWDHRKSLTARGMAMVAAACGSFLMYCTILFSYYMGDLTKQWTIRLGILFLPFIIAPTIWALFQISGQWRSCRRWFVVGAVALMIYYWPVAGANAAVREIIRYREFTIVREILEKRFWRKTTLVISDFSNLYVPLRWSSVNFGHANKFDWDILNRLKNHLYPDTLAVQHILFKDGSATPETALSPRYTTEPIFETQLGPEEFLRISRVSATKVVASETLPIPSLVASAAPVLPVASQSTLPTEVASLSVPVIPVSLQGTIPGTQPTPLPGK